MSHAFYVYSSYGFAAIIVIAIIGWTWIDGRLRQRELETLEASGIHRRPVHKTQGDAR
jgi:heme exporter protein D